VGPVDIPHATLPIVSPQPKLLTWQDVNRGKGAIISCKTVAWFEPRRGVQKGSSSASITTPSGAEPGPSAVGRRDGPRRGKDPSPLNGSIRSPKVPVRDRSTAQSRGGSQIAQSRTVSRRKPLRESAAEVTFFSRKSNGARLLNPGFEPAESLPTKGL